MNPLVGDLVAVRKGIFLRAQEPGKAPMKGIVYEAEGLWIHIMWADESRTSRFADSLEVVSGT